MNVPNLQGKETGVFGKTGVCSDWVAPQLSREAKQNSLPPIPTRGAPPRG